ncbi:MAG: NAD(P)/FAD-dependent oxidoreductase [Pseudomonadota bacterium]
MHWDAIVIGGGHNGLTCAAYLARAGRKVLVLERREVVGGAAVTESFHPGFRNSLASYTVSLLHPQVIKDLDLHRHGLRIVSRPAGNFLPLPDGRHLLTGTTTADSAAAFLKFSKRDAERLPAYYDWLEEAADILRAQVLSTPPNAGSGIKSWLKSGQLAWQLSKLSPSARESIFDLFTRSAASILDRWFEDPHIKALFAFDAIVGNFASPYDNGSAYVLLHHVFGETNGVSGAWGHAIGGMGAITQAMAASAEAHGAVIRTNASVARIATTDGRATGVVLDNGETHYAKQIAGSVTPKHLLLDLCDDADLPEQTKRVINATEYGSGTFRMNVALDRLPSFTALPGDGPHLSSGIIIAPTMDYMERAYLDAKREGWSREPVVEMLIPSTLDDSLAPDGKHVASLFCQHVQPQLSGGRHWDDHRDEVAQLMINTVDAYAPGFASSVLGYQALSPFDLEKKLGLTNGDIFHGRLSLGQLFSARPALSMADYRMPIPGLYLCGSGAHPGGGVSGIPGHNAAREMLRD